jgi:hypothetical protein
MGTPLYVERATLPFDLRPVLPGSPRAVDRQDSGLQLMMFSPASR